MKIKQQIKNESVRVLYEQSKTSLLGLLILTSMMIFFFWGKVEHDLLLGWFASILLIHTGRILLIRRFNKIANSNFNATKWSWLFVLGSLTTGVILGSSAFLFMDFSSANSAIFLTLVMSGTVAGSMAALSPFLPAFYLFTLACLLPLAFQFYQQGGELFIFAGFILLFLIMYFIYAKNMHETLITSIKQRFENRELLNKLTEQTRIAEQANMEKSRFLAATSHDLRQPLHSLGLFLHVLKGKLDSPEQKQLMEQTEKSQRVLSEQLNTIIDIAHIDANKLSVNKQAFQLKTFIDEIVGEFTLEAENTNCSIRTRVMNDWTHSDKVLLARIARNFISNVFQHCPGSSLLIATRRRGNNVELMFIDNGPGLAEAEQKMIFSEFYQLNNPERDRNKGLGLGLSIVKRLTKLLNMNLSLESHKDKGSKFTITLPLYITEPTTETVDKNLIKNKLDVAGLFVVVVDDVTENLEAMKALLTLWECETLLAKDEAELMKEFNSADYPAPDMLLIDYRLGENKNGFEVIEAVRKHFNKIIPAAIITGDTTLNLESNLTTEHCQVHYKPLSTESLTNLLNRKTNV